MAGFNDSARLVPDVVRGVRIWNVDEGRLKSVSSNYPWQTGWNYARCGLDPANRMLRQDHLGSKAGLGCGCGFWAYWETTGTHLRIMSHESQVKGIIEGKGRAVVGTEGFRVQQARVVALVGVGQKSRPHTPYDLLMPIYLAFWVVFYLILLGLDLFTGPVDTEKAVLHGSMVALFSVLMVVMHPLTRRGLRGVSQARLAKDYPDVKFYSTWEEAFEDYPVEVPDWKEKQ